MAFLDEWYKQHRAEWLSHVSEAVQARVATGIPITWAEWQEMRMNSYEQEELYPLLDNEALCKVTQHCLNNCSPRDRKPCSVYDDAVLHVIVPLLLERLKEKE
jgi:hypothetical protein